MGHHSERRILGETARGGAASVAPTANKHMLTIISATCLLFAACALLYQADDRRSAFAGVRGSQPARFGMRASAIALFALTLMMLAPLQGWERGIPLWLGLLSLVFVAGLFLAAQKPAWHAKLAIGLGIIGVLAAIGALL
ncbi:MAG: hypothetical protein AAFQ38_14785 [Pseudomonadota bacterium]